ncbi:chemotaxis protein CheW [Deinococcus lacus]|uniref:Chemotaxis protein CheW n=1 Tax=Deinococcus lacus TaxID=392561 RepID=A0ABW1YE56_9DEIO
MAERLLLFRYSDQAMAIPAAVNRQVFEMPEIAPLPGTQFGLLGLVSVGGQAIPAIDLDALAAIPHADATLALLIDIHGEELVIPIEQILGYTETDESLMTADLMSAPTSLGDYTYDFDVRVINPSSLIATLQARLTPV